MLTYQQIETEYVRRLPPDMAVAYETGGNIRAIIGPIIQMLYEQQFITQQLIESCFPHMGGFTVTEKKCECGAEKANSTGHSTWCPKF